MKYLTKKEIDTFKQSLEELKGQLLKQAKKCVSEVQKPDEATGYSQHQADQGTDDFDRQINLGVTANELQVLKDIERALTKIEEGTYGICDITGEKIPKKRLEAMPYALTTVKAKEMMEKGLV